MRKIKNTISKNLDFKIAFEEYTLAKKREFCEYISSAKREIIKQTRFEKIIPMILIGVGLIDKYRNC